MPALPVEHEVEISNPGAGITLAGTLAVPDDTSPKGAILLASGSGPQNRDEEIAGHKPFKILSDSLASSGYAVLRMDDRGTAKSGGVFKTAIQEDFISDAEAALSFLDSCFHDIPKGILGHSAGGTTAIRLASRGQVDFIVTLGAPAWRGDSLIMSQSRALATALTGGWEGEETQRKILEIARGPLPASLARTMIYAAVASQLEGAASMPAVQQRLSAQADAAVSPWYRDMLRHDPADDISRISIPWIALNGERDTQVLPDNLSTISSLNPAATTVLLPRHNHLFQECSSGLPHEYSTCGQAPSPETIAAILSWLEKILSPDDR